MSWVALFFWEVARGAAFRVRAANVPPREPSITGRYAARSRPTVLVDIVGLAHVYALDQSVRAQVLEGFRMDADPGALVLEDRAARKYDPVLIARGTMHERAARLQAFNNLLSREKARRKTMLRQYAEKPPTISPFVAVRYAVSMRGVLSNGTRSRSRAAFRYSLTWESLNRCCALR